MAKATDVVNAVRPYRTLFGTDNVGRGNHHGLRTILGVVPSPSVHEEVGLDVETRTRLRKRAKERADLVMRGLHPGQWERIFKSEMRGLVADLDASETVGLGEGGV